MRLLKIKDSEANFTNYICINKISRFCTIEDKNNTYSISLDTNGYLQPIATGVKEPDKIIEKILNAIEITEDNIITFSVIHNDK